MHRDVTNRVRACLGITGTKLPRAFHGSFECDGVRVLVKPAVVGIRKSSQHRVFVDLDGRFVPTGRVQQSGRCYKERLEARLVWLDHKAERGDPGAVQALERLMQKHMRKR